MKRFFSILFFIHCFVASYAQVTPLGQDVNATLNILEQKTPREAFEYWCRKEQTHKADSLYTWANANIGQRLMTFGCVREAEVLLDKAWTNLDSLESDDSWWWQHRGYVATRKAMLYLQMHDNVQAHTCAVDAKIAFEQALLRGVDYAISLSVLANTTMLRGYLVLARTFAGNAMLTAYQVCNAEPNEENLQYLIYVLTENANIESQLGYYQEAIQMYETIRDLCSQFNIEHPNIDFYLGATYVNNAEYSKAISCLASYYEQCPALNLKIQSGAALLFAKYKLGHKDLSQLAYDVAKLQVDNTSKMFSFMSSQEKERWWMSYENEIMPFVDLMLIKSDIKGVNGIIANNEIFAKGLLLRASNQLKTAALGSNDQEIVTKYYSLEELKSRCSQASNSEEQVLLENQISKLEKELQSRLNTKISDVSTWQDVALNLNKNEVALEFVRFENMNEAQDAEYYAIIVRNGDKEPRIVHLFNESSLKPILENKTNKPIHKYVTDLYSTGSSQYKGEELYELVWSKVEKEIKGCKTIYYSPAGLLNAVSLQAISNGKSYLGEKYTMHLVSSIGSVPQIKAETAEIGAKAVVYGGIQYDVEESMMIQASRSYMPTNSSTWDTSFGETRRGWKYLPGTDKEAKSISSMFTNHNIDVKLISGTSANEESFKALSGKGFNAIHIATHGFFLSDNAELKKNAFINPTMSDKVGFVDPMMRAGLLFAGGNRAWTGKRHIKDIEDGILTAKEISTLDFSSVDLVVLSACQTGLGDVKANEGVYGLQRAFKLAGVQTIIMSLWEVDDRATSIMMSVFYEKYLEGYSKDNAFKYAIDAVRNYEVDGKQPFNSPYYWAGFVMMD